MGKFSEDLINMLTDFLVCQIGSKTIDGVTYDLMLKDSDLDMRVYDRYNDIRKEADNCGYRDSEVFRVYRMSNGYIMDMDLMAVKQINSQMLAAIKRNTSDANDTSDVTDMPERQRKSEVVRFANYLKSKYDKGIKEFEVALYNRESTGTIIINGVLEDGRKASVKYDAFAIRHWDIETVNKKIIAHKGFIVRSIVPCEILPNKEAASFIIRLEGVSV